MVTDLDNTDNYISQPVENENGEKVGDLVIEASLEDNATNTFSYIDQPLSNKTFSVKFIGVSVNFGYKATVKNKKITNAYGAWSNGILWQTTLGKPYFSAKNSGVKGQTKIGYKDFSGHTTVRLRGKIQGNRLKTYLSFS